MNSEVITDKLPHLHVNNLSMNCFSKETENTLKYLQKLEPLINKCDSLAIIIMAPGGITKQNMDNYANAKKERDTALYSIFSIQ
jgi:copper homeostasis protein CutC